MNHRTSMLEARLPQLRALWRQRRAQGKADPHEGPLDARELKEVAAAVRRLSLGLTRERELAGARYMDHPELLGAYLLFFWPVSYAQACAVLGELPGPVRGQVLDLGAGPAPLACAALDRGATHALAADRAPAALGLGQAIGGASISTVRWDPEQGEPLPAGAFDLVLLGHVLNELFLRGGRAADRKQALIEAALARVAPGGSLVILEPALQATSRALLSLRDRLVAAGVAVRAPCLWRGPCPALEREADWCHAERHWELPDEVARIAHAAELHKESLKMSYLILAPPNEPWPTPPEGRLFRIVSEPLGAKGRARYIGCGAEGRTGLVLTHKYRHPRNQAFFELSRGDLVRIGETDPKGDGLALRKEATVEVVAAAGEPLDRSGRGLD